MIKYSLIVASIAASLLMSAHVSIAAESNQVYGSQLMTQQERVEFHARLRNASSNAERERIRNEHHKKMQKRAEKKGLKIADEPPTSGAGKGAGKSSAGGNGPGGGKGR